MKGDLESIKRKREGTVDEEFNPTKRQCRRPSTERRVYDPVYIFCKKIKFMKNPKSREKLIQAVQLRADTTLRNCAILKNDARILVIISRDIVATEAHYHASCYKSYTNIKTKEHDYVGDKEVENSSQVTDMLSYEVAEVEAYVQLFHYIRNEVIPHKKVVPVAQLTEKLEAFMSSKGELSKLPQRRTIVEGLNQN